MLIKTEPVQDEQKTREKIISVASGLFFSFGLEKTPIQKIIDEVGIAKGTFYHHFKSKEDLVSQVMDDMTERVMESALTLIAQDRMTAREKLIQLFRESSAIKMENMQQAIVMLRQMLRSSDQDFRELIAETAARKVLPVFIEILKQGARDGSFRISYPEESAELMVSMSMGIGRESSELMVAAADGDAEALERLTRLMGALEQGFERILGVPEGTLPVYEPKEFKRKMKELNNDSGT